MPRVIGVDSSTQSCKVLVVDVASGEILSEATTPHPEGSEIDPEYWWSALRNSLDQVDTSGVEAISIGAQQHGLVALDARGVVLRPALAYYLSKSDRGFAKKIYLLGADHHGYIHRLKALAGAAGDDPAGDVDSSPGIEYGNGDAALRRHTHRFLADVPGLIESFKFNVAVARTMEMVNHTRKTVDQGPGGGRVVTKRSRI